jgi:hypothetical protein
VPDWLGTSGGATVPYGQPANNSALARIDRGAIPGLSRLRTEPVRHPRRYGADIRGCHVQTPNNRGAIPVQTSVIMDEPV